MSLLDQFNGVPDVSYQVWVVHENEGWLDTVAQGSLTLDDATVITNTLNALDNGNSYALIAESVTATVLIAAPPEPDPVPDPDPEDPPAEDPPAEDPPAEDPESDTPIPDENGVVYRDAATGRYVTPEYAAEHPDTTVSEQQ